MRRRTATWSYRPDTASTDSHLATYDDAAQWYDRVWGPRRDHRADSSAIAHIARQRNPHSRSLLDVGCATGEHLRHLTRTFDAVGVDVSPGLLQIARSKLGERAALYEADMFHLDLDERFDVVTCLWGTIAYATTPAALRVVAGNIAHHLTSGGLAIIEPWLTPDSFDDAKRVNVTVDEDEDPVLTIVSTSRRDQDVAELRRLYVAAAPSVLSTVEEHHRLGLFTVPTYRSAFEAAGLQTEWLADGLSDRGLLLASKGP